TLDQVVLGATVDRVVAETAGEPNVLRPLQRAFGREAVVAGTQVGHHPARRPFGRASDLHGAGPIAAGPHRNSLLSRDAKGRRGFVESDDEVVVAPTADQLQSPTTPGSRVDFDVG